VGTFRERDKFRVAFAIAAAVVAAGCFPSSAVPQGESNPFASASRTATVYFVPLDAHAQQLLKAVVPTLQPWLLPNQQLDVIDTKTSWVNPSRYGGELNTVKVWTDILNEFRDAQGSREVALFSVSSQAVYSPSLPHFSFVFGAWGQPHHLQYSVVLGTLPMRVFQPAREKARLTKMMLRYIGEIVCNPYLQRNTDPHSVMYSTILGSADLDRMVATLPSHCRRH
jgi:hypothetical protein